MLQTPSTILMATFQRVSADSVITDRHKNMDVAVYVSIDPLHMDVA